MRVSKEGRAMPPWRGGAEGLNTSGMPPHALQLKIAGPGVETLACHRSVATQAPHLRWPHWWLGGGSAPAGAGVVEDAGGSEGGVALGFR